MAEKLLVVCDICGSPAVETVTFKAWSSNHQKDYCAKHLQELLRGSRSPRPGRRAGSIEHTASTSTSGAKKTAARKKPSARKRTAKKTVARKRASARKKTMARKSAGTRTGFSKNGKRLGRPPGSGTKKKSTTPRSSSASAKATA